MLVFYLFWFEIFESSQDATTQYFRDHDIHEAAKRKSVRLKAAALLYTGKVPSEDDLIVSFQAYSCKQRSAWIEITQLLTFLVLGTQRYQTF